MAKMPSLIWLALPHADFSYHEEMMRWWWVLLALPHLIMPAQSNPTYPSIASWGFFFCPKEGMEWVRDTYDPTLSSLIAIPIRSLCSFDLWHITTLWGVSMPSQLLLKKKKKFPYLFPLVKGMSYI